MSISKNLKAQLLARFDELIVEGEGILTNAVDVPPVPAGYEGGGLRFGRAGYKQMNLQQFVEWRIKATTLLSMIIVEGSIHGSHLEKFSEQNATNSSLGNLESGISFLKAIRDDFKRGFLDNLLMQIEAEIASDYMGQAEELLKEGRSGQYDHVPAAVLAGAVLEKALRKMCDLQKPPIPTNKPNGEPKTLSPLIDDLKAENVYNELKAKQLRSWADIRNKAAHGEFEQFKKEDVEQMISGISIFLAEYLR